MVTFQTFRRQAAAGTVAMRNEHLIPLSRSGKHLDILADALTKLAIGDVPIEMI